MKKIIFYILLFVCLNNLYSQNNQENKEQTNEPKNQPFDLPNAIIYGKDYLHVRSGVKALPEKTDALSSREFDSINTLEKQQASLLPPVPTQDKITHYNNYNNFLESNFGRFTTGNVNAGYGFKINDYDFYLKGGFELSDGHVENAEYNKLNLLIQSDYVAPEKYWLFGGSKTTTKLTIFNNNYKTFAEINPDKRKALGLDLAVNSNGYYDGILFNTGFKLSRLGLNSDSTNGYDNGLNGYLKMQSALNDEMNMGLDLGVDFHSISDKPAQMISIAGMLDYKSSELLLESKLGIQLASGTDEQALTVLNLNVSANYLMNKEFSLKGEFSSGLRKNFLSDFFMRNHYLNYDAAILFQHDLVNMNLILTYHPDTDLLINVGVNGNIIDNNINFINDSLSLFDLSYEKATIIKMFTEVFWKLSAEDKISFDVNYFVNSTDNYNKRNTYLPDIKSSVDYFRNWGSGFSTVVSLNYVGIRYADLNNNIEIPSYFNINILTEYKITEQILLNLNMNNLSNSNIIIWNGYKERNLFLSFGVLWQF